MSAPCPTPLPLADLIAYVTGEDTAPAVEEHYFACERCAKRLAAVQALRRGVEDVVRRGRVRASVTGDLLEHAAELGVRLRSYRLEPQDVVPCTAGPDDDVVILRLGVPELGDANAADLRSEVTNLDDGSEWTHEVDDLVIDHARREIVVMFPGELIRRHPRSRWRLVARLRGGGVTGERSVGPYVLDHTPWERLESAGR